MAKQAFTSINIVLDKSGSMADLADETIKSVNKFIEEQKAVGDDAIFTMALFSDKYELLYDGVSLKEVKPLDHNSYKTDGWTALLDAIAKTINSTSIKIRAMKEEDRPSKVIFMVITDGAENSSREFNREQVFKLLDLHQNEYKWQAIFLGCEKDSIVAGEKFGFTKGSSYTYSNSKIGAANLYRNISDSVASYRLDCEMDSLVLNASALMDDTKLQSSTFFDTDAQNTSVDISTTDKDKTTI